MLYSESFQITACEASGTLKTSERGFIKKTLYIIGEAYITLYNYLRAITLCKQSSIIASTNYNVGIITYCEQLYCIYNTVIIYNARNNILPALGRGGIWEELQNG